MNSSANTSVKSQIKAPEAEPKSLEVSIIIPAYNASETIAATLESVLAQTHPYWEAIVVDDGSTDGTAEVAQRYVDRDQRIRMVQQRNGGEAAGRNGGLPLARYDWILFLDADDWISPLHLEHMTAALLADPDLDAVHCGSARVAPDGTQIVQYSPPIGDLFSILAKRAAFNVHACIFRKSFIENVGMLDTSLKRLPDWDFWQRIARTGANFGAVREVLAFYRMRPNSASLDATQLLKDGLRILKQGHAPDPRVKKPHPNHVNGMPTENLSSEQFYFLSWCAGLVLGNGEDARPLLQFVDDSTPELWPDAIAQCIFESAPLSQSLPPQVWESFAYRILKNTDDFLQALEKYSRTVDLATRAGRELRKMILKHSPNWQSFIETYERRIKEEESQKNQFGQMLEDQRIQNQNLEGVRNLLQEDLENRKKQVRDLEDEKNQLHGIVRDLEDEKKQLHGIVENRSTEIKNLKQEHANFQKLAEEREIQLATEKEHLTTLSEERATRIQELETEEARWKTIAEDRKKLIRFFRNHLWVRVGKALNLLSYPSSTSAKASKPLKERAFARRCRAVAISTMLLSILQGFYFEFIGSRTTFHSLAIVLAIISLLSALVLFGIPRIRFLASTVLLYAIQLGFFVFSWIKSGAGNAPHLLTVGVVLSHAAILASAFLGETRLIRRRKAILLSFAIAAGVMVSETALHLNSPTEAGVSLPPPKWIGNTLPHPTLGEVYRPYSTLKTIYPENPRGYFTEEVQGAKFWWIRTGENVEANLIFPDSNSEIVKADIKKVGSSAVYDIQLNKSPFVVEANQRYSIDFQARAVAPRSAFVGFSKAHDTWTTLGFYAEFQLTPDWKHFRYEFTAQEQDQNGRIHFDLGSNSSSVEFSSVLLRHLPDQKVILPTGQSNKTYSVGYRFNELGCRGSDYEIPSQSGIHRIVALGDSYTLGVGVYENDLFTNKLQQLLNRDHPVNQFEVINCGVSSYGTHEERLFYEQFAYRYQPNIVLLMMVNDDNKTFRDDSKTQKTGSLFYTWSRMMNPQPKVPNFSGCLKEIHLLNKKLNTEGARLVVVIFRNDPDYSGYNYYGKAWNELTRELASDLNSSSIPVLDLGKAFFENHNAQELMVDPRIDSHPNEIAHKIAANEIYDFLKRKALL
jgi:hypothetical protein